MSETKPQKAGRVFFKALDSDWAITEEAYRTGLKLAARIPFDRSVESVNSPKLEYTRTVTVRDGVAIVPIEGAIFRYADFFTEWCGGCTVEQLAKDFTSALNDDKVHAILFEINSPGGEITGISELAEMIFAARNVKPMTARVGGMMCSAALWLGTAAGDVRIDDTARIGSIGVMATYLDDRKQMEMIGLEDIEFISSQSPYKNAKPWTDEGRKRIQARVDSLCQVFGEKVAEYRGVSIDDVWKNFGQGDVFVGQEAIDAGLADSFGSFEDVLYDLARTHNPYFVDTRSTENASEKTINISSAVNSQLDDEAEDTAANDSNKNEDLMSEQNKDVTAGGAAAGTAVAEEEAPATITDKETPASTAAEPAKTETAKADEANDIESLRAQLAESKQSQAAATARIADLEKAALDKWIDEATAGLAGEVAHNKTVLGALVTAHGKDSAEVEAFLENQKAMTAQLEAGGLFSEIGKGGSDTDNSAEQQLETKAKALMAADSKLSIQQARTQAYEENPDLYAQMQADKG